MSNETRSEREVMLMNPETGSVDSERNWKSEMDNWANEEDYMDGLSAQEKFDLLIEVRKVKDEWLEDREIDMRGITPLHLAVCEGDNAEMTELIMAGADINEPDFNGETPLHYSINSIESTSFLLNAGADPRIADNDGDRPSEYAKVAGFIEIAKLLESKEQELDLREKHGVSKDAPRNSRDEQSL